MMETMVPNSSRRRSSKRSRRTEDPVDFLCAEEMGKEYLVRADGSSVRIESLRGKFVGVLLGYLYPQVQFFIPVLKEVYDQIRQKNGDVFELVFVAMQYPTPRKLKVDEDEGSMFDMHKKLMPLCVPFDDFEWRERLRSKYQVRDSANQIVLFDREGRLLQQNALTKLVHTYGAAYYPFTAAREKQIVRESKAALRSKSLKALLGSGSRDFVISNDGHTKVPISQLEGKVIGVYLYNYRERPGVREKLVDTYLQLKSQGRSFEIVFVNVDHVKGYTDETSFLNNLRQMPWLALPFKDDKIRALEILLSVPETGTALAILGAQAGKFAFSYGLQVVQEYGIHAYPFTLNGAVNAEIERLSHVKLPDVFEAMGVESLFQKVGEEKRIVECPVSSVLGKRVILYFARRGDQEDPPHQGSRLMDLHQNDGDGSFQVVFVSLDLFQDTSARHFHTMPMSWLAVPFWKLFRKERFKFVMLTLGLLMAFAPSGDFLSAGMLESFGCEAASFPFISYKQYFKTLKKVMPSAKGWEWEAGY